MNKLSINLENCYGISALNKEFDFSNGMNVHAIYASNGVMKTSLAKTFVDVSNGIGDSKDKIYPENNYERDIKIDGADLKAEDVFVIKSYDKFPELSNDNVAKLLIHPKFKKKYDQAYSDIQKSKDSFLNEIKSLSGKAPKEIELEVSKIFHQNEEKKFFEALKRIEAEVMNDGEPEYEDVVYAKLFNDSTAKIIGSKEFKDNIEDYVTVYNNLLNKSNFFRRGIFNHVQASDIAKQLDKKGFFGADHSVLLNSEKELIKTSEVLEEKIENEKVRIINDTKLKAGMSALLETLDKKLKNEALRDFRDYLSRNPQITSDFSNVECLKSNLWIGYFKKRRVAFESLLKTWKAAEATIKKIKNQAKEYYSICATVINEFNTRFLVPFEISVPNQADVILNNDTEPEIEFKFYDKKIEQDSLREVLSQGERRALYILDILFEIEVRKKQEGQCLLIVDDIADSFDYKNKYAIIEYLKDISEVKEETTQKNKFYLLILTHNFDFFRTLESRGVSKYQTCSMAIKNKNGITLPQARYIKNPFKDWKEKLRTKPIEDVDYNKYFVAFIPFVRNLIEYQKGKDDDYITLSNLLHYREKSANISLSCVIDIFSKYGIILKGSKDDATIQNIIFNTAEQCSQGTGGGGVNLEDKIVLSIAARIKAEEYMMTELNHNIEEKQIGKLFKKYRDAFADVDGKRETIDILRRVVLMVPSNIHINSFMYEPILDMGVEELQNLYNDVKKLK